MEYYCKFVLSVMAFNILMLHFLHEMLLCANISVILFGNIMFPGELVQNYVYISVYKYFKILD